MFLIIYAFPVNLYQKVKLIILIRLDIKLYITLDDSLLHRIHEPLLDEMNCDVC